MSSLLQRRNKKFSDLQKSISIISTSRKGQQTHQQPFSFLPQYHTTQDLPHPQIQKSISVQAHPIPQSAKLQSLRERQKQLYDFGENAFQQNFKLQQKLGEGAHGIVKKCTHRQSGKNFAVKFIKMQDEHYRSIKTNFINIKQLKHQNLLKYKAIYLNTQTRLCKLVMEYCPYKSLKPGLDENTLRFIFYKLFDALSYLHQKHICHRDIKPANILYDVDKRIVKLIDFGVSKNMKLRGRYQQMFTNTGTCYYKAPEMFLGGSYTQKVDCWAMGITLYELIAGQTPFESEYYSDTINNILSKQVWFQSHNFTKFSSLVKDLITRLLKKDPKERLTCEQAYKHLWFVPHLNDIDLMQSAGLSFKTGPYSQQETLAMLLQRRNSVNEVAPLHSSKLKKGEKQTMKRWLQMINQDQTNPKQTEYTYDLSQSEDQSQTLQARKSISLQQKPRKDF